MPRHGALTSLIFPTFNPGPALDATWEATRDFLSSARGRWEVLFVCDGCTDGTPERLRRLASFGGLPVRVLTYPANRGKGFAVRQGMLSARGKWRVFADVDLAYGFDAIERVARKLRGGADVVVASRGHPASEAVVAPHLAGYVWRRRLQGRLFGMLARRLLPLRQRDTQAGLKGMSGAAARLIMPRLRCDGFGFDCELLTACARFGLPVAEVPVRVHYRDAASTTGRRAAWRMLADLFRIRHTWKSVPDPLPPAGDVIEFPAASPAAPAERVRIAA